MCDFISYIKNKDGIFYLTDKEVFGSRGLEMDFKNNDPIGHGAIEKYYGVTGEHKEVRDFWNTEKLPGELAKKLSSVESFLDNWGLMLKRGCFENDDLRYLVRYAPDEYRALASEQLLKQSPTKYDLRYLVRYAPDKYRSLAWKQLLKQSPTNYDLTHLVEYAPDEYRALAKLELKKQTATGN